MEWLALIMFLFVCLILLLGYPVAFSLAGASLIFAGLGIAIGAFDDSFIHLLPNRIYGVMINPTLMAVPLFVFMGVVLEKSQVAERLLDAMAQAFSGVKAGLGISITLVGMLLAASTGIVGATVVTMGLLSLPAMLKHGYSAQYSSGIIAATGTLGQIIPPSIALVLLGDVISSAYQQAQLKQGIFNPEPVSVGELFAGAVIPGLILVLLYMLYSFGLATFKPASIPEMDKTQSRFPLKSLLSALLPPLVLIVLVLGSILAGFATPTEAAGVGATGALLIAALHRKLSLKTLQEICVSTLHVTAMVFMILIGASLFSLVFRGFGGEELIHQFFANLPGGVITATLIVMLIMFLLGFILDFIEITFVVVPLVAPVLLAMGLDPVWLGIMIAVNLQTSFLTPPFGFALFYLRGVAPDSLPTRAIYQGVIPFIFLQLVLMAMMAYWPILTTWLPDTIYKS
ncbi:TRAP transporter large permease [Algicola sagamiensis]|uniref:TRAP transporter large permease n=1 Tax=Algicola sagamiensis TaxID=163869 RepID=UPI00037A90C7|nr:TRAP transporter large permease subunit [Algicola sagamiensis]